MGVLDYFIIEFRLNKSLNNKTSNDYWSENGKSPERTMACRLESVLF